MFFVYSEGLVDKETYMKSETQQIEEFAKREYKYGFVTNIEMDVAPPGLNPDVIRFLGQEAGA